MPKSLPHDLVPLGIVHIEDHRSQMMEIIQTWRDNGKILLWGHPDLRSPDIEALPQDKKIALNWVGGPDREGGHPDYPDLTYYCDVSASPAPKIDPVAGPLYRREIHKTWTKVLIRKTDLTKAHKAARLVISKKRLTATELDTWMNENVGIHVKRDLTISACCHATGATAREATAAFSRLPAERKLGRGKKPTNPGKSNAEIKH
jgi:hypothetical protein